MEVQDPPRAGQLFSNIFLFDGEKSEAEPDLSNWVSDPKLGTLFDAKQVSYKDDIPNVYGYCAMLISKVFPGLARQPLVDSQALIVKAHFRYDNDYCQFCRLAKGYGREAEDGTRCCCIIAAPILQAWRDHITVSNGRLLVFSYNIYRRLQASVDTMLGRLSKRADRIASPIELSRVYLLSDAPVRAEPCQPPALACAQYDMISTWITDALAEVFKPDPRPHDADMRLLKSFDVIDCAQQEICHRDADLEYVALSYVWGEPREVEDLDHSFSWDKLPLTIRDAAQVTLALGYRCLWVDRYCIDQRSPDTKQLLIDSMHAIYAHATFTIVAAAGEDAYHGLPGISSTRLKTSHPALLLGPMHLIALESCPELQVLNSVWATRGWTYQEDVLSPRRLVFCDGQIAFSRGSIYYATIQYVPTLARYIPLDIVQPEGLKPVIEGIVQRMPHDTFERPLGLTAESLEALAVDQKLIIWRDVASKFSNHIARYSERKLRYESDVLNAISGVLNGFSTMKLPIHHCWGLPIATHKFGHFAAALC